MENKNVLQKEKNHTEGNENDRFLINASLFIHLKLIYPPEGYSQVFLKSMLSVSSGSRKRLPCSRGRD